MDPNEKVTWSALEYEEKERNVDWFWALGIVIIAGSIASIIFSNYFFAVLLIIGGILLGFFAIKKPERIFCELNEKGLRIKEHVYLYGDIKAFWVQKKHPAALFFHSKRLIMPIISIPIEPGDAEKIQKIMLAQNITEVEMKEHFSEKVMNALGF